MTRKDYTLIAKAISNTFKKTNYRTREREIINNVIDDLADRFLEENPLFDYRKFVDTIKADTIKDKG